MRGGFMLLVKAIFFVGLLLLFSISCLFFIIHRHFNQDQIVFLSLVFTVLFLSVIELRITKRILNVVVFLLKVSSYVVLMIIAKSAILDPVFSLSDSVSKSIELFIGALSWLISATLIGQCVNRYVFFVLEDNLNIKLPRILTGIFYTMLYGSALAGILAFVMNFDITKLLAASGILTIVIGLALRSNLANVFSGLFLMFDKPFRRGDFVMIGI